MQIWAFILLAYLVVVYFLRGNFSELLFNYGIAWWVALMALGLIGAAFARPVKNLLGYFLDDSQTRLYALAVLFCIGGMEYLNTEYSLLTSGQPNNSAAMAIIDNEAIIQRSWDGHFRAIAKINDANVGLLIDTGASLVLLRYDDAERIGIDFDKLDFSVPLTTASGKSYVAPITIDTLKIGNVTVHDVKAAIAERGALHSSLLGMSFLEIIGETVIRKNVMILRN